VVRLFVKHAEIRYQALFLLLHVGKDWLPGWNPVIKKNWKEHRRSVILGQLTELAENYGDICEFWLDMRCWATPACQHRAYDLLKGINPGS
jgi:hypothetical protein